jgi:hypothetical protein
MAEKNDELDCFDPRESGPRNGSRGSLISDNGYNTRRSTGNFCFQDTCLQITGLIMVAKDVEI